jgi:diamine N-acetyltransferase
MQSTPHAAFTPYADRRTVPLGWTEGGGSAVKLFAVHPEDSLFRCAGWRGAVKDALARLPGADPRRGRPGLAFFILHQGRGADYLVQNWWDRENELFARVDRRVAGGRWERAREGESSCVWDLEIQWRERGAYVREILGPGPPDRAAYLEATLGDAGRGNVGSLLERAMRRADRIVVRPTGAPDVEWVAAAEADPGIGRYITRWPASRHREALADLEWRHLTVCDPGGAPVGYLILRGLGESEVELHRLVVTRPGEGFGRAALRWAGEAAFDAWGADRLWLDVYPGNARARGLYRSEGYREVGTDANGLVVMERVTAPR